MNPYLKVLAENPEYVTAIKELAQYAPVIPAHNSKSDNTEKWKAESAKREGFEYCLTLLGFKLEEL